MLGQALHQPGFDLAQETGGKLVQQAADLFGRVGEQLGLAGAAVAVGLRAHQRVFERARQGRQVGVADGGRVAGQRMRQRHRGLADRLALVFERPFGQLGAEPARQFVGLVEVDVEQRDADAQVADHLDLLVVAGHLGLDFWLGLGLGFNRHRGLGLRQCRQFCGGLRFGHRGGCRVAEVEVEIGEIEFQRFRGRRCVGYRRGCRLIHRHGSVEFTQIEVEADRLDLGHRLGCRGGREGLRGLGQRRQVQIGRGRQVGHTLGQRRGGQAELGFRLGRQIEVEVEQQLGFGQRLGHRFGRQRDFRHLQAQRRRQRRIDHDTAAFQPQRVGWAHHVGRDMAVVAAGGDGFGPAVQVVQRLAGQRTQCDVHVRRHRQARVEQLFAGPGRFAEVLQPDHARAALQRVEGAAHRCHLAQVVGLLGSASAPRHVRPR